MVLLTKTHRTLLREKEGWKNLYAYYKRSIRERVLVNFNSKFFVELIFNCAFKEHNVYFEVLRITIT